VFWAVVISVYGAASVVTLVAYGVDKRRAASGRRRIKERTLHSLELAGGWPGGLVGQKLFKHKRAKGAYMMFFWAIVMLHTVAWVAYLWLFRA
jgi:uncharacterized membrane protein YsdA (DUF1294 family)